MLHLLTVRSDFRHSVCTVLLISKENYEGVVFTRNGWFIRTNIIQLHAVLYITSKHSNSHSCVMTDIGHVLV